MVLFLFAKNFSKTLFGKLFQQKISAKIFSKLFHTQRGKPKIAYYGGVRGLKIFKKKFFSAWVLRVLRVHVVRKTKKLLLWGLKRTASLYGRKFFSAWGNQ